MKGKQLNKLHSNQINKWSMCDLPQPLHDGLQSVWWRPSWRGWSLWWTWRWPRLVTMMAPDPGTEWWRLWEHKIKHQKHQKPLVLNIEWHLLKWSHSKTHDFSSILTSAYNLLLHGRHAGTLPLTSSGFLGDRCGFQQWHLAGDLGWRALMRISTTQQSIIVTWLEYTAVCQMTQVEEAAGGCLGL